ncbi:uridylyltransferase-like protein [Wolffia australiana]
MSLAMATGNLGICSRLKSLARDPQLCPPGWTSFNDLPSVLWNASSRRNSARLRFTLVAAAVPAAVEGGRSNDTEEVPIPKVTIDQDSDPDATVVEITFGDRLGALLDTMRSLRNLGLNVVKANVFLDSSGKHNTFAITKASTGRKVDDPEVLEAIRLTIINNLIQYHPESSSRLAMGATFGSEPPTEEVDIDIATHVNVYDDGADRSLLVVETADRPGLLVDIVKVVTDISVAVESGEFDTEGLLAKAKFHVNYRGKALIKPLQLVVANSLRYFLRRPSTEDASF